MLEASAIICVFIMFMSTLIGVVDRALLGIGLPWTDELARFFLIWGTLLSAVIATKRREHFSLMLFTEFIGKPGATAIDAVVIAALGIVVWYGIGLTTIANIQMSPALGIPMSWIYVSVPISATLMIGYIANQILQRFNIIREHS